jgi:hypothetical protein
MTISDLQALADRVDELRAWAGKCIAECQANEGDADASVRSCARVERYTLQAVLRILDGGKP